LAITITGMCPPRLNWVGYGSEALARILVIAAHPQIDHSRATRALMRAAARLPAQQVAVRELYALYPDYLIDTAAERQCLADAELLVWLHPVHWYSMPALLKLWLDEVFAFGWAYGPGGNALQGKALWLATSTGGPESSYRPDGYNGHFFDAFLRPCEQTAALTGMRWLPPLVLHGSHRATDAEIDAHAARFSARLAAWPSMQGWPQLADRAPAWPARQVPADARPAAGNG
jgi:glutathione-regulated potassium-efflux system ancillary protein KefF